jgi:hypothetical protein
MRKVLLLFPTFSDPSQWLCSSIFSDVKILQRGRYFRPFLAIKRCDIFILKIVHVHAAMDVHPTKAQAFVSGQSNGCVYTAPLNNN